MRRIDKQVYCHNTIFWRFLRNYQLNSKRSYSHFSVVVALLIAICANSSFAEASVLILPADTMIIEHDAFCNDSALEAVIVPEGCKRIEERAFANSSITEVTLPKTITYIAEDAFQGCYNLRINVPADCYAYDWCVDHGFINSTVTPAPDIPEPSPSSEPDYSDVASFEEDINAGMMVIGKTVQLTVETIVPDSAYGYNLQAGEHLNFCSYQHPGVQVGDTIIMKIEEVENYMGSYIISYTIVEKLTTQTITPPPENEGGPDYLDAAAFEKALNTGADLRGKTVRFKVDNITPDSSFGYNLQAGEHLNFCSNENPYVNIGDTITVEVKEVKSLLGSYIIYYDIKNY